MKSKKSPSTDLETLMPMLIGAWRRFHKLSGPADALQTREFRSVVAAVKSLHEKYEGGKSLIGRDYFEKPDLLGAYLLYYWPLHYLQGMSLIGELPTAPRHVLELCSGPAPFAFAALRHGALTAVACDQNETAMKLGAEVCGRYGLPISIRKTNCLSFPLPIQGKFDLIILGHCLEEMFPHTSKSWEQDQMRFIQKLFDYLTPEGHLLIVDSSFSEANRRVLQIRDQSVKNGVPIQAPCVWKEECPALKTPNSPCFAQREFEKPFLMKEIQRGASINLSSLKMSYVILKHPLAGWPTLPDKKFYRVTSPPIKSFHGERFYLCGTDGKKTLSSRLSTHPSESKAFEYLRRGELISVSDALEQQAALDIIEGSTIKIEAACGKPLPEVGSID